MKVDYCDEIGQNHRSDAQNILKITIEAPRQKFETRKILVSPATPSAAAPKWATPASCDRHHWTRTTVASRTVPLACCEVDLGQRNDLVGTWSGTATTTVGGRCWLS